MSTQKTTWHKLFDSYQEACVVFKVGDIKKAQIETLVLSVGRRDTTTFFAVSDSCTHEGISLSKGQIKNNKIECPWHHYLFDIKTGVCLTDNSCANIKVYQIRIDDSGFYIGI